MPSTSGSSDQAVTDFINERGVGSVTHLLADSLWSRFGLNSMPSWMTITADGTTRKGSGALPRSVLDGSWAS